MEALLPAFRQEVRKLGWIERKNIALEYRFGEQKPERAPELAADLVRLKVDLIVVTGGPQALAAKKATTIIPIVMTNIWDPVGAGQARRAAGGATEEIRAHHQSESGEANRPHDSA